MTVTTSTPDRQLALEGETSHATVHVNAERCVGCQECVIRCPTHALSIESERWIASADDALCVGCRQCQRVCPYSAISVSGARVVAPRREPPALRPIPLLGSIQEIRAGFRGWPEVLAEADRCLNCPDPTCMEGCPAHIDIPGFIAALREQDLGAAKSVLLGASFLSGICSRVCDQSVQCEGACTWSLAGGEAVSIGRLERFVADHGPTPQVRRGSARASDLDVAVVGSGPAGMAAAWELLSASARVTLLEKDDAPGGVLRWGIPSFTLPEAVVTQHIDALQAAGVRLRTGFELGRDASLEALLEEHDAVILAHGASLPLALPIPGRDLPGVEDATAFLNRAKPVVEAGGRLPEIHSGVNVLVLGGGNTAMDAARTVRRLGGHATAVEWMDERFARVRPDELAEARDEGVDVRFSTTVERLEGDAAGVRQAWLRATLQRDGTKRPQVTKAPAFPLEVQRVIVALGYRVDPGVARSVAVLPLPSISQRQVIPDRRWTASGIPTGPTGAVGTQALQREMGLAVATSPIHDGWWSRLRHRRPEAAQRFRAAWWARLWKRQQELGSAAAPEPRGDRVWVAGDALVGPSTVVGSMAQGRAAARAVIDARPRRSASPTRGDGRAATLP